MSYPTYQRPIEPLVERNLFRVQPPNMTAIPSFAEAKTNLPEPILPGYAEWVGMYWRSWEIAWSHLQQPTPANGFIAPYLGDVCGQHLFMWDSALKMQFALYGRRAFNVIETLDNFYAKQHDDGFICREISMETGQDYFYPFDPNSTGPNILAWAEWRYFRLTGDDSRIESIFWPLLAYHKWCRENRTWPNGLYWATGLSSGMDNQPRIPNGMYHHHHWSWVDATMQAALNCHMLAQMATMLEETDYAIALKNEHLQLVELINTHFWNADTEFYQDVSANGRFSQTKTIGAYWGLLDPNIIPSEKRQDKFIQHLREGWAFKTKHSIPSISADSPGYDEDTGRYWRGGVWPAMNFMVARGLRTVGQHKLVHNLAMNHLQNIHQVFLDTGTFWENYAPETAAPGDPAEKEFIGTTGLATIVLLLEDIIGVTVEWPHRRVYFDRRLDLEQACGLRNYPVGPEGTLDLFAEGEKLVISTDTPFTLIYRDNMQTLQTAVNIGATEIDLS